MEGDFRWTDGSKASFVTWLKGKNTEGECQANVFRYYVCLFVCLSVCLFVCLSVCLFVCLSVCLFVCWSVCLFVCLSVRQFVCLSVCLSARVTQKLLLRLT